MKPDKKQVKFFIKLLVTSFAFSFVLTQIDFVQMKAAILTANLFWLFAAFIAFNLSKIVSAVRLNYYFRQINISLSQIANLKLYYIGMFYNLFLPGGIGGDGYKIYLLHKHFNTKISSLISATLLDRISGLIALLVLAGILFSFSTFAMLYPTLSTYILGGTVGVFLLFLLAHTIFFKTFIQHITLTTLLAFVVQIFQVICALFITLSLSEKALVDYTLIFLISSIIAVLPLTVGGVGARELTFLYAFGLIALDPTLGVTFSLLFFLITMLSSAIGLLFLKKPLKTL